MHQGVADPVSEFSRFSTLSFDCYGTLIDWESGIANAMRPWSDRHQLGWRDEALIAAHARHETVVQQEHPGAHYRSILSETIRRIAAAEQLEVTNDEADAYAASVADWPAFPDSAPSLKALGERFRLVILSNVDRASFAASNERLDVEFELVVTAEDVGSYKPDRKNFFAMFDALTSIGVSRRDLLHVAESLYHDHEPALSLGLPSVWIHRRHGKAGLGATAAPATNVVPPWRFETLAAFADAALA